MFNQDWPAPSFDDDIAINNASYTLNGGAAVNLALPSPWTLANDVNIAAGATNTYVLTIKVTMDLNPTSGGDNRYTECGNDTPGDPMPGEGLFNESRLDKNNDGTYEEFDEACGDLPYVTATKTIGTITPLGGNMYNVNYTITVQNKGGVTGQYDLVDAPSFDDDIAINNASYTLNGGAAVNLALPSPWTLANDVNIAAGATNT